MLGCQRTPPRLRVAVNRGGGSHERFEFRRWRQLKGFKEMGVELTGRELRGL
jgi:hypothetical protein